MWAPRRDKYGPATAHPRRPDAANADLGRVANVACPASNAEGQSKKGKIPARGYVEECTPENPTRIERTPLFSLRENAIAKEPGLR
jgi:hypothetical protein